MTALAQYHKSIGRAVFKGDWGKAVELLRTMHHRNLRDTKATNMVMDALIRAKVSDKALALLRTLDDPDVASYSIVMRAHPWHKALELMQEMQARAVTPNVVCYGAAISACERGAHWQGALQLLGSMQDMTITPNTVTYNACMSACEKGGQWNTALQILAHMLRTSSARRGDSDAHYSPIASSGASSPSSRPSGESRHPVHSMAPDVVSFSACISACEKAGHWQKALTILQHMGEYGVAPNTVCYNAAITACSTAGRWGAALRLLGRLRASAGHPDMITYNALIEGIPACDYPRAASLYREACAQKLYPHLRPPRVDFHEFSVRVTLVALRVLLEDIATNVYPGWDRELHIIVGRGLHSAGDAKLKPAVWDMLQECGLKPQPGSNPGRLRVFIPGTRK